MAQAFFARKYKIPKSDPVKEVYKPAPYYYGTLTTDDAARQISEESSLTKGDVLNVLDRYQHYVAVNLQKGYKVELLGFGTIFNRFTTQRGVDKPEDVNAKMITTILPGFSPAFTLVNRSRRYSLMGEKTVLTRVDMNGVAVDDPSTEEPTEPGGGGGDGEL